MKKIITLVAVTIMVFALATLLTGCGGNYPTLTGVKGTVKIDCGTDFNLDNYLNDNLKITDEIDDSTKEYKLKDLEYEISCEGDIYNSETGAVDTSDFGKFATELTVKDENGGKATLEFTLKLNPLIVEKGYYIYGDDSANSGLSLMGYCSYTNGSSKALKIDSIEFQYFDDDGIMVCSTNMPETAPMYVGNGQTGYGVDTYSTIDASIEDESDVTSVKVNIKYKKAKAEDSTTLECSEGEIIRNYEYNGSGFGAEFVVTNSTKKKGDCILLAGMYDADDNLIGVMDCMDQPSVAAGGKAKVIACWLPDSKSRPDKTVNVKAAAYALDY